MRPIAEMAKITVDNATGTIVFSFKRKPGTTNQIKKLGKTIVELENLKVGIVSGTVSPNNGFADLRFNPEWITSDKVLEYIDGQNK